MIKMWILSNRAHADWCVRQYYQDYIRRQDVTVLNGSSGMHQLQGVRFEKGDLVVITDSPDVWEAGRLFDQLMDLDLRSGHKATWHWIIDGVPNLPDDKLAANLTMLLTQSVIRRGVIRDTPEVSLGGVSIPPLRSILFEAPLDLMAEYHDRLQGTIWEDTMRLLHEGPEGNAED